LRPGGDQVDESGVTDYWNHNVHYQRVILEAVPGRCGAALDVGCGDGMLACKLAACCREVTGIDRNAGMVQMARERGKDVPNVAFIDADFLAYPFGEASFDLVCANTVVHHMDFAAALTSMKRILRPGGHLAIVGLGRDRPPVDWFIGAAGIPADLILKSRHGQGRPDGIPVAAPGMTWGQVHSAARRLLPGARYRRHLLWRYSLVWTKPS
jgi:SAM-dependent methyltransferase